MCTHVLHKDHWSTLVQMIDRIGVRELRNQVAAVIRRAGSGERLIVTVDGKPIAQLGPLEPDRSGVSLWDLAGAGLVEPPRRSDRPMEPAPLPVAADLRVDRLMDQVRSR